MTAPSLSWFPAPHPERETHAGWRAAFLLTLALLLGALLVWTFGLPGPISGGIRQDLSDGSVAVVMTTLLTAALILGHNAYNEAYWATLLAISPFLPVIGAVAVVLAYLAPGTGRVHQEALYLGTAVALSLWVTGGAAFHWMACAKTAQSRSYGELLPRARRLRSLLDSIAWRMGYESWWQLKPVPANPQAWDRLAEARSYSSTLDIELGQSGLRFAMATGYVNLWRTLHRAEEALIEIDRSSAVGDAIYDYNRLSGSSIPNCATLQKEIEAAIGPEVVKGLFGPTGAVGGFTPSEDASAVVKSVRTAINEYRDDQWEGLIRERNRLLRAVLATALVTFLMVGLAIVCEISRSALVAVSGYFLTGAIIGLFSRLRAEEQADSAVDDYGLFEARLIATAQISGLAAVAGVFLVALAPVVFATPDVAAAVAGSLSKVLDLGSDARGLVVAAAFGLTPDLLIAGLSKSSTDIKQKIVGSEAAGGK